MKKIWIVYSWTELTDAIFIEGCFVLERSARDAVKEWLDAAKAGGRLFEQHPYYENEWVYENDEYKEHLRLATKILNEN